MCTDASLSVLESGFVLYHNSNTWHTYQRVLTARTYVFTQLCARASQPVQACTLTLEAWLQDRNMTTTCEHAVIFRWPIKGNDLCYNYAPDSSFNFTQAQFKLRQMGDKPHNVKSCIPARRHGVFKSWQETMNRFFLLVWVASFRWTYYIMYQFEDFGTELDLKIAVNCKNASYCTIYKLSNLAESNM